MPKPLGSRSPWVLGSVDSFKVSGKGAGGAYAVEEAKAWPGQGPPPLVRLAEDEYSCEFEGTFSFLHPDRISEGGPGTSLRVDRGDLHTSRCEGDSPGRVPLVVGPDGLDRFREAIGLPVDDPGLPPTRDPGSVVRAPKLAPGYHLKLRP